MEEIWADVPGYEGLYKISTMGNIYSERKKRLLVGSYIGSKGKTYPTAQLCDSQKHRKQKTKYVMIHRLMAEVFLGNIKGKIVRHLDDDSHNNVLSNLAIGSHKDNSDDARRNGTRRNVSGEEHGACKLTDAQIREAAEKYKTGRYTYKELAAEYNMGHMYLNDVFKGRRRAHLNLGVVRPRKYKGKASYGRAKINQGIADRIRVDSRKYKEIANEYGISVPTVSSIKRGHTWNPEKIYPREFLGQNP